MTATTAWIVAVGVPVLAVALIGLRRLLLPGKQPMRLRVRRARDNNVTFDCRRDTSVEVDAPKGDQTAELVQKAPPRASTGDDVDVSVFSPPSAAPGASVLVQVLIHLPEEDKVVAALAAAADSHASRRGVRSLAVPVELGTVLDVELLMPGLDIDEPIQKLKWDGHAEAVQYGVTLPAKLEVGSVLGTVKVSRLGIPIGSLRWTFTVDPATTGSTDQQSQGEWVDRYRKAFISYTTADRREVLARVQILRALHIDFFQDVLSLEPGERWEQELYKEIALCDLFLLFWSSAARESDWVHKETSEALRLAAASGAAQRPTVSPVLIEGPPVPKPWPELAHLHFNDELLYVMNG